MPNTNRQQLPDRPYCRHGSLSDLNILGLDVWLCFVRWSLCDKTDVHTSGRRCMRLCLRFPLLCFDRCDTYSDDFLQTQFFPLVE